MRGKLVQGSLVDGHGDPIDAGFEELRKNMTSADVRESVKALFRPDGDVELDPEDMELDDDG